MAHEKKKRKFNWKTISWMILLIAAVIFFFMLSGFIVFPKRFKLPLIILLAAIVLLMALLTFMTRKSKVLVSTVNFVLSFFMLVTCVFLPILESKLRGIFTDQGTTEEFVMMIYAFTPEYKAAHPDIFNNSTSSQEITDYTDAVFLKQDSIDQENQEYVVGWLKEKFSKEPNTVTKTDVLDMITAFYNGEGDCIILNEVYEELVNELEGFGSFKEDTFVVAEITREVAVEPQKEEPQKEEDTSLEPFRILVAGEDTRSRKLKVYGRTDVDIVMTVNPKTKQILVVGFPRDSYIPNPALKNRPDKLTHLGNNGIQNTVDGLSAVLETQINDYFVVNFKTFQNIIDALGGIDVDNPYKFRSKADTERGTPSYTYEEGVIHLNGLQALSYCRERYNLPAGDYGRSEHQTIVLKSVINKLTSTEMLKNFSAVLDSLQGQFITSYSTDNIYAIVQNQLDNNTPWNIVSYHLGGRGDMQPTASMGAQKLYVNWLLQQQLDFSKAEMEKVMNGEALEQGVLPEDDETLYRP